MMGVGELDAFHAKRLEDAFDRKRRAFRPHERVARTRMRLPARHGRGGIVEHAHRDVVLVVYGIGNARDAAREKRRIAHESKLFRRRVGNAEALRHRDARAHTQTGIHSIERLGIAQGVTADIARKDTANAHFLERLLACVKRTTMGAACAQHRWACGKLDIEIGRRGFACTSSRIGAFFNFTHELVARNTLATQQGFIKEFAQTLNNIIGIVLASIAARARRTAKNPRSALTSRRTQAGHMNEAVFNNRVKLLEHDNSIEAIEEFIHAGLGERERRADLHETIARKSLAALTAGNTSRRSRLFCRVLKNRKRLFRIRGRHAAARDADFRRIAVIFDGIEARKIFRCQTTRRLGSACA